MKDIFGNKKKSNKDEIKKVSNKALPKHMQTKNLLDAARREILFNVPFLALQFESQLKILGPFNKTLPISNYPIIN